MGYSVNFSVLGSSFVLPCEAVDKHIKMANEAQIKTILWIFRHSSDVIDAAEISKKINKSTAAVEEALCYWASVGILNSDILPETQKVQQPQIPKATKILPDVPEIAPSYEQIMKRVKESPELAEFFNEIQKTLGKTVGYDGQVAFVTMIDSYGLPVEVIFMLVSYCVSIGKSSYRYISKIAKSWGDKEIDTIEKADREITDLLSCKKLWQQFTRYSGIEMPKPTRKQEEFLLKWTNTYKFNIDMICLAYDIMCDNLSKISFSYMDKILISWYQKGIKTPEQVEKIRSNAKSAPKKQSNSTAASGSYNMGEFEQRAQELPIYKRKDES